MEKVCLLKSCIWLIHTLGTSYKYCRDKEVTAILRHLSAISIGSYRLQGTPEGHPASTPHSNRATSNQLSLRSCTTDEKPWNPVFRSPHSLLTQPIWFGYQDSRRDLSLKALLKSKIKVFNILCAPPMHMASHPITESNQVSKAWSINPGWLFAITLLSFM